jgi:hypothetical protein
VQVEYTVPHEPHCKVGEGASRTVCWNDLDNIVARLVPRRAGIYNHSTNTILLSSHYDTVTMSPGAYDDSTGVAAMLELVSMSSLFSFINFSFLFFFFSPSATLERYNFALLSLLSFFPLFFFKSCSF